MSRARSVAVLAAAALGLGLALGVAAPASAHDTLLDADPAPGDVLTAAPEELTLTYSGEIMDLGRFIEVIDADGRDWASGESSIDRVRVLQPLESGMPDGSYQVRWQVVSEDGHPISGFYDFAIGEATPGGIPAPSEGDGEEPAESADEGDPAALIVVIVSSLAALAAGVTTAIVVARKRRAKE